MGWIRRMGPVAVAAVVVLALLAGLGQLMMPRWQAQEYTEHIVIENSDPAIKPRDIAIAHEGDYATRERRLTVTAADGVKLPAVLREPVGAPGRRPACLFIHGSGTSAAEDFGDIANAMASAGIVTLVPAKRMGGYTALHRDYSRFADDYSRALDKLRALPDVDSTKTGVYAESEGTWISTLLSERRHDLAFSVLTSAPVFKGREQMAMAVSAYAKAAGAPDGVIRDVAKLMSMDFAPFDLRYADFDADGYRDSLTMPVLVNYGTLDPAMPVEQGALTLLDEAETVGNRNVTVRYYQANHQLRAGRGLFTPGLPLAEGYTKSVANWVNGVAAGAGADDWATPMIAGMQPDQRYAAPEHTPGGIVSSLGILVALMAVALLCPLAAGLVAAGARVADWRRRRRGRAGRGATRPMTRHRAMTRNMAGLLAMNAALSAVLLLVFAGYLTTVILQALHDQSNPMMFQIGWFVMQADAVVCAVMAAWLVVRLARAVRCHAIRGVARWMVVALVLVGVVATLVVLAFWGLYSL